MLKNNAIMRKIMVIGLCFATVLSGIPAYAAPDTATSSESTPAVPTGANPTGTYSYTLTIGSGSRKGLDTVDVTYPDTEFKYNGASHRLYDNGELFVTFHVSDTDTPITNSRFTRYYATAATNAEADAIKANPSSYASWSTDVPRATHHKGTDGSVYVITKIVDNKNIFNDFLLDTMYLSITPVQVDVDWNDLEKDWGTPDPALTAKLNNKAGTATANVNEYKYSIVGTDDIVITTTRAAGEAPGPYAVSIASNKQYLGGVDITDRGDYEFTGGNGSFVINNGILDNADISSTNGPYDGETHTLDTDGLTTGTTSGTFKKVEYSTDGTNWSEDVPGVIDANAGADNSGDGLPVYVRVTGQNGETIVLNDVKNGGDSWYIKVTKVPVTYGFNFGGSPANVLKWDVSSETALPDLTDIENDADILSGTLADGDEVEAVISLPADLTWANIEVGHDYPITIENVVIKKENGSDNSANYIITKENGVLRATNPQRDMLNQIKITGWTGTYDGAEHHAVVNNVPSGFNMSAVNWSYKKASEPDSAYQPLTITGNGNIADIFAKNVADSESYVIKAHMTGTTDKFFNVALTISKATLNIKVNDRTMQVGQTVPAFDGSWVTITGEKGTDGKPAFNTDYTLSGNIDNTKQGEYPVTCTFVAARSNATPWNNYNIVTTQGKVTVNDSTSEALRKIVLTPYVGTYDGIEHNVITNAANVPDGTTFSYSLDGVNYSNTMPKVKNRTADNTGADAALPVFVKATLNGITVELKAADGGQYKYRINPIENAVIAAIPASKTAGAADPAFTATTSGFISGEISTADYSVTRSNAGVEAVGTYNDVLVPALKNAADAKWTNYKNITLRKAAFVIKNVQDETDIKNFDVDGYDDKYDGKSHSVTLKRIVTGMTIEYSTDNGSSWTTSQPKVKHVKDSTSVWVKATKGDYSKIVKTNINITRRSAKITANDATKVQGASMPDFSAKESGFVDDDDVDYDLSCNTSDTVGVHNNAIKVNLSGSYPDYTITLKSGTLTVLADNSKTTTPTSPKTPTTPGTGKTTTTTTNGDPSSKSTKSTTTTKTTKGKVEDKDNNEEKGDADKYIDLVDHDKYLVARPSEDLDLQLARFVIPEEEVDMLVDKKEKTTVSTDSADAGKHNVKAGGAAPYIAGAVVAGVIAVAMGLTGAWNMLWLLLLGLLFAKKRKKWHGLLTYETNMFVKVQGDAEGVEDMQDIINKGVSVEELRTLMESTDVMTILPAKTEMTVDIEGMEEQTLEADEDKFYELMEQGHGYAVVTIFNAKAKFSMTVEMDLH